MKEARELKKKYPKLKESLFELGKDLKRDPITGHDSLGKNCFKVRMKIIGKSSGQSGGARVIIEVVVMDKSVYLLSIYEKGTKDTVTEKELDEMIKNKIFSHPK